MPAFGVDLVRGDLFDGCRFEVSEDGRGGRVGSMLDVYKRQVSNNAVAISHDEGGPRIFSFMGIGPKKTWDAVTTSAYEMDPNTGKWTEKRPVPGVAGRLAASAVALHDQVFIFGGYVLDAQGGELSLIHISSARYLSLSWDMACSCRYILPHLMSC